MEIMFLKIFLVLFIQVGAPKLSTWGDLLSSVSNTELSLRKMYQFIERILLHESKKASTLYAFHFTYTCSCVSWISFVSFVIVLPGAKK